MLLSPPAGSLHADSDVESLSHGWEEDDVRGHIFGSDDPPMGWCANPSPSPFPTLTRCYMGTSLTYY